MFSISLTDPANPDFCVPERNNLAKLDQFLKGEQEILRRLNLDFAKASVAEKPSIRQQIDEKKAEISQLNGRIKQAQQILEACDTKLQ